MNRVLGKFIVEEFRIIHEFWWRSPVFVWRFPTKGEFQKKKLYFHSKWLIVKLKWNWQRGFHMWLFSFLFDSSMSRKVSINLTRTGIFRHNWIVFLSVSPFMVLYNFHQKQFYVSIKNCNKINTHGTRRAVEERNSTTK